MTGCRIGMAIGLAAAIVACPGLSAVADEGGVSFWLPGQYGSFAAVAPAPGWSLPVMYYHYSGSAGATDVLPRGHSLSPGLAASFDGMFVVPTYTPDVTVLGAHPSISVAFAAARSDASARIGIGPLSASRSDQLTSGSDLYPTVKLFWTAGVHNFMTYVAGDIPVGGYSADRLANVGIGHAAIDAGGAYTWLNTKTGTEASATLGFTNNFENQSAHYTNGVDVHLDLGAAQFLSERFFVGLVGYYYQQVTADKGQPAALGGFMSRSRGVGPQIGYNFDLGGTPVYANLRGYSEFGSHDRMQGFAIYGTVNVPLSALFNRR